MQNNSGIHPMDYNILVRPLEIEEKTAGGVILPDDARKADSNAQTKGLLVAVSPMAFVNSDWPEGGVKPKVGDMIAYARYAGAGSRIDGKDGVEYAIMKDNDITAVLEE